MCHLTAMSGYHKHAVSSYNQFQNNKPTWDMIKRWNILSDSIFAQEGHQTGRYSSSVGVGE